MALFNVLFDIAARTAKFEESMTRVERRLNGLNSFVRKATGFAVAGFSITGVARYVDSVISAADETARMAKMAGLGVRAFSELAYAAKLADVPAQDLSKSIKFMQVALAQAAQGNKSAIKDFDDLGVSWRKLRELSPDQQFEQIAEALNQIQNPAERTRLEIAMFGKAGNELRPLMENGAAGIRTAREEAVRLGHALDDLSAGKLVAADDALKKLKISASTLGREIVTVLAPGIENVARGMTRFRDFLATRGDDPLSMLYRDLAKVRQAMRDPLIPNDKLNQLNSWAQEIGKLIDAYERAAVAQQKWAGSFDNVKAAPLLDEIMVKATKLTRLRELEEMGLVDVIVRSRRIEVGAMERYFQEIEEDTRTSIERQVAQYEEFKSKLDVLFSSKRIDATEYNARIKDQLDEILQPIEVSSKRIKALATEASEFWKEAFRGMQGVLADFLFDPFDKGVKGMLRGFIDVVRRMVAEAASAKILDSLFGALGGGSGSGFLGKLFGGLFKADGGPVERGRSYVVGERGPELFTPAASGSITPNHAMATASGPSISITNHIDARGSSISRAELNAVVNRSSEVTIAKVRELVGWGRI